MFSFVAFWFFIIYFYFLEFGLCGTYLFLRHPKRPHTNTRAKGLILMELTVCSIYKRIYCCLMDVVLGSTTPNNHPLKPRTIKLVVLHLRLICLYLTPTLFTSNTRRLNPFTKTFDTRHLNRSLITTEGSPTSNHRSTLPSGSIA